MLFQMAGNVEKCAQLTSTACFVCMHLGGQYFAELASDESTQESLEVRHCLGHCYIMDKSLSLSLGRRSFLPEMQVDASVLMPPTPEVPSTLIFNIYIEFARIQDDVAREMRQSSSQKQDARALQVIEDLRSRMERARLNIRNVSGCNCHLILIRLRLLLTIRDVQFRSRPPQSTDDLLRGEWMGIDFTYFGLMTIISRLHPHFDSSKNVRELCYENARQSLSKLRDMELHAQESREIRNAYCLSVCW